VNCYFQKWSFPKGAIQGILHPANIQPHHWEQIEGLNSKLSLKIQANAELTSTDCNEFDNNQNSESSQITSHEIVHGHKQISSKSSSGQEIFNFTTKMKFPMFEELKPPKFKKIRRGKIIIDLQKTHKCKSLVNDWLDQKYFSFSRFLIPNHMTMFLKQYEGDIDVYRLDFEVQS